MKPRAKGITIKDVAERAGVSASTVSYALNGKRPISPKTRRIIDEAIRDLGYTSSALAQRLRLGRSHTLGVLYPWDSATQQTLAMELLAAASEVAAEARYTLAIYTRKLRTQEILELLGNQVLDGLLLAAIKPLDERVEVLRHSKHPFVIVGRTRNMQGLYSVDFDYRRGCYEGLEYLARLGHTHLAAIAPPHDHLELSYVAFMEEGFEFARRNLGIRLYQGVGGSAEVAYQSTLCLLERYPEVSGIFATHSRDYVGIMRALREKGLQVPEDCSVVAIAPETFTEITVPRLTAIDLPLAGMGQTAMKMLLDRLEGRITEPQVLLYTGLREGESAVAARPKSHC
jgi:DNA-binding LacI/PurR family transcriptional regulator